MARNKSLSKTLSYSANTANNLTRFSYQQAQRQLDIMMANNNLVQKLANINNRRFTTVNSLNEI